MKLFTPETTELIEVTGVKPHQDGMLIEGKIMGALPMQAVLRPEELRAAFRFLSFTVVRTMVSMLFRKPSKRTAGAR
jgi:hypothetical protein